jgi:hypothetical protein
LKSGPIIWDPCDGVITIICSDRSKGLTIIFPNYDAVWIIEAYQDSKLAGEQKGSASVTGSIVNY